jgi:hypothetical protein
MKNRHSRYFSYSTEALRPWVEALWSGTSRDCFPTDVIPTFRRNPDGIEPLALVPGVTKVGHGGFTFQLSEWTGNRWRVELVSKLRGWHGFELVPEAEGVELVHTLEVEPTGPMRLAWPLVVEPIHDWVIEALFDRLEIALRTGEPPRQTARPMPLKARLPYEVMRRLMTLTGVMKHSHAGA